MLKPNGDMTHRKEEIAINFQAVLFDLDGTLLDTLKDLADAMNVALEQLGFPVHPVEAYNYFVGDGIRCEAERALPDEHCDDETIERCVAMARQEYDRCWADNTRPYPGIPDMLDEIQRRDLPMTILSNKPDDFVQVMVKKLLPSWEFQIVLGLKDSIGRKPDPGAAIKIASQLQIAPKDFLYLGDTNTDMQTATRAGMYAVGALWGFRDEEELISNGAQVIVKEPQEIIGLL
ncbi:MAG: HAD family hydrolase [Planctomycetota bacterium]|jgi:phosphoglycolate phosphatase